MTLPVKEEPARDDLLTPFHGVLHRSEDWPDADDELLREVRDFETLAVWEGTKIGGAAVHPGG